MKNEKKPLKILLSILMILSSCSTVKEFTPSEIPRMRVCIFGGKKSPCRDTKDPGFKPWAAPEDLINYICIPPMDFDSMLNAIAE